MGRLQATNREKHLGLSVRVTGGELRGREILSPGVAKTHPMGARERLALFNMIGGEVVEARVLDAYAGTGALGIEALSRGAREAVFVEKNPKVAEVLRRNLANLGLEGRVVVGSVRGFVEGVRGEGFTGGEREGITGSKKGVFGSGKEDFGDGFDMVLADPPYDRFEITEVERLVRLLKSGGVFILSHPGEAPEMEGLELVKSRKYAGARISVYR